MKHWDLTPNEHVELIRQDGVKIGARFLFHTTVRACFTIRAGEAGEFREFELLEDGNLRDRPTKAEILRTLRAESFEFDYNSRAAADIMKARRKIWRIAGADRHTRTVLEAVACR